MKQTIKSRPARGRGLRACFGVRLVTDQGMRPPSADLPATAHYPRTAVRCGFRQVTAEVFKPAGTTRHS